jgi:putative membrane protein
MQQRGFEAAALVGVGSLGGVWALVLLAPFATRVLSALRQVLQPHVHWLLGLVVVYILLSEWPKGSGRGRTALGRLWDGWKSLVAGLATFALSGMLGLITAYHPLIPLTTSSQGLAPAFVGLFAVPWVVQNLIAGTRVPEQQVRPTLDVSPGLILCGIGAGTVGGVLSAFLPAVSAGVGGLIAGQATARRDDRLFIISQGTCKAVYYVGGLLFFFVPGVHLTRGGAAWMLSPLYRPYTAGEYWLAVGAAAMCGALAFVLLLQLSRGAALLASRIDYRWVSLGTLAILVALVAWVGGWGGLLICATGTGIGLIPVLYHSRRMNCMGVLLVPMLLEMSGLGPRALAWLGLA